MSRRPPLAIPLGPLAAGLGLTFGLALCLALPLAAAPLLDMPAPATQIGGRADTLASLRLPIGPFAQGSLPQREVEGAVDQRAYRMENQHLSTLELLAPLRSQLEAAGYQPLFQCETAGCGGFDFRYGMEVLPEPQMHVDLGDFRYVLAERSSARGPDLVALLVSRSADTGFVQVTSVGNSETRQSRTGALRSAPPPAAEPQAPPLPEDFGASLIAKGALALEDLVFASGSAALADKDYGSLAGLAAFLAANPGRRVMLVGHTDASGSLAANTALSKQRAQSVRARLIGKFGVAPAQIQAEGAGFLAPRASNETEAGRQLNRRVEVMLQP